MPFLWLQEAPGSIESSWRYPSATHIEIFILMAYSVPVNRIDEDPEAATKIATETNQQKNQALFRR